MDGSKAQAEPAEPTRVVYQPGDALYSPKDPAWRTFTVESGVIDVLSVDCADDPLIATYYRGSTFGYPDGVDHSRLPAVARAREKSVVWVEVVDAPTVEPAPMPGKRNVKGRIRSHDVLRRKVLYPGNKLFSEGDSGDTAFIIESGTVEVFRTEQGKEIRLGLLGPGSMIGEMALIDDQPRMATARALTQSVSVAIGRQAFQNKLNASDPFIRKLLRILVRYIRLHADYFVKAKSDLQDTYLVLGLDPEDPDIDKLQEISWQRAKGTPPKAEPAAPAEAKPGVKDHGPPRQRPPAAAPRRKPAPVRQSGRATTRRPAD